MRKKIAAVSIIMVVALTQFGAIAYAGKTQPFKRHGGGTTTCTPGVNCL